MPCRDDYGPREDNDELIRLREISNKQKRKIDKYARLLCFVCTHMPSAAWDALRKVPKSEEHGDAIIELTSWWLDHQETDRQEKLRKEREAKKKRAHEAEQEKIATAKAAALKKLTADERKLLGIA